jgi:hypothetical protein
MLSSISSSSHNGLYNAISIKVLVDIRRPIKVDVKNHIVLTIFPIPARDC